MLCVQTARGPDAQWGLDKAATATAITAATATASTSITATSTSITAATPTP